MSDAPELAARLQRALEPYQSMVYMVPEGPAEYEAMSGPQRLGEARVGDDQDAAR